LIYKYQYFSLLALSVKCYSKDIFKWSNNYIFILVIIVLILSSLFIGKILSRYNSFSASEWATFYNRQSEAYQKYAECSKNKGLGEIYIFKEGSSGVDFETISVSCDEELHNSLYLVNSEIALGRGKRLIQIGRKEFKTLSNNNVVDLWLK